MQQKEHLMQQLLGAGDAGLPPAIVRGAAAISVAINCCYY